MPQTVKLEDGSIHTFPDDATPQEMQSALAGWKPTSPKDSISAQPPMPLSPEWFRQGRFANSAPENARGGGSGNTFTPGAGYSFLPWHDAWIRQQFFNAADKGSNALPAAGATVGALAGEGLGSIPGAALGGGAGEGARQMIRRAFGFEGVPQTSGQAAKDIATQGATQGTLQAIGMGGGKLLTAMAPKMAESALSISPEMRSFGKTPGEAVLNETQGVRPATIARQARQAAGDLTQQMEANVHAATQTGVTGSTQPAHQVLNDAIASAPRNARGLVDKLNSIRDMLDLNPAPLAQRAGQAPRMNFSPDELLEIKRGIGTEINTWAPEWRKTPAIKQAQQGLYRAIDSEIDRLVPGNAELNQRISSLIPVKGQAAKMAQGPSMWKRVMTRVQRPTGALIGSTAGAALGYKEGGPEGAALGWVAGAVAPEMLSSPTTQMIGARLAQDVPQKLAPWAAPFLRYAVSRAQQ